MRINLFGNLRISCGGRPVTSVNTSRLHSLIAYLILHGDTPQPRERLAFVLWPGSSESQARTNLRQLLHHLKRALPAECKSLLSDHYSVRWRQEASCEIDVADFQAAIAEAASARTANDRAREIQSLTAATQLCEDDLLPGLYDDWLTPFREEYRQRVCEALRRLATLFEEQREFAAALPFAERLVALDPLAESNHQLLMRLHVGQSRPIERAPRLPSVMWHRADLPKSMPNGSRWWPNARSRGRLAATGPNLDFLGFVSA